MERAQATLGPCIEVGTAVRPMKGEAVSGDRCVATAVADDLLMAVVDGLGHGPDAAAAAMAAVAVLEAYAHEALVPLVERCHAALRGTRGVGMSVASFSGIAGTVTWIGVGNVEGVLVRSAEAIPASRETLLTRGGIVGYRLPPLRASVLPFGPGDMLALATDGIATGFVAELVPGERPQRIADRILDRYAKDADDALVLIARRSGTA